MRQQCLATVSFLFQATIKVFPLFFAETTIQKKRFYVFHLFSLFSGFPDTHAVIIFRVQYDKKIYDVMDSKIRDEDDSKLSISSTR